MKIKKDTKNMNDIDHTLLGTLINNSSGHWAGTYEMYVRFL